MTSSAPTAVDSQSPCFRTIIFRTSGCRARQAIADTRHRRRMSVLDPRNLIRRKLAPPGACLAAAEEAYVRLRPRRLAETALQLLAAKLVEPRHPHRTAHLFVCRCSAGEVERLAQRSG